MGLVNPRTYFNFKEANELLEKLVLIDALHPSTQYI